MANLGNKIAKNASRAYAKLADKTELSNTGRAAARNSNKYSNPTNFDLLGRCLDMISRAIVSGQYYAVAKINPQRCLVVGKKLCQKKYMVFLMQDQRTKWLDIFWYGRKSIKKLYKDGTPSMIVNDIISQLINDSGDISKMKSIKWLNKDKEILKILQFDDKAATKIELKSDIETEFMLLP